MPDAVERCRHCGYPVQGPCGRCRGEIRDPRDDRIVLPGVGNPVGDFAQGFAALFQAGAALLLRREYQGRLLVPVLLNLLVLSLLGGGLFYLIWSGLTELLGQPGADAPGWLQWLSGAGVGGMAMLLTTVSLWYTFPLIVELLLSPFLDPLAEATESAWVGNVPMPALDPSVWGGLIAGVRASAQILLLQLLLWIPMLLISFTGIGVVIALLVAAWLNALIWFEIPGTRRGYQLRTRVRLLRRNAARAIGLGCAFQLGLLIPVFNILLLTPAAAVAASALFFRFEKTGIRESSLGVRPRAITVERTRPPLPPQA